MRRHRIACRHRAARVGCPGDDVNETCSTRARSRREDVSVSTVIYVYELSGVLRGSTSRRSRSLFASSPYGELRRQRVTVVLLGQEQFALRRDDA